MVGWLVKEQDRGQEAAEACAYLTLGADMYTHHARVRE